MYDNVYYEDQGSSWFSFSTIFWLAVIGIVLYFVFTQGIPWANEKFGLDIQWWMVVVGVILLPIAIIGGLIFIYSWLESSQTAEGDEIREHLKKLPNAELREILHTTTNDGYSDIKKKLDKQKKTVNGKQFKTHYIGQILRNPIYMGVVGYNSSHLTPYVSSDVEPIVSKDMFELATEKRRCRTKSKKDSRYYPLRKKVTCPSCGRKLNPRRQIMKEREYFYYACHNKECDQLTIAASIIEKNTIEIVRNYLNDQKQLTLLIKAIQLQIEKRNQLNRQSIVETVKRKEDLFSQYEQGEITIEKFKLSLSKLNYDGDKKDSIDMSDNLLEDRLKQLLDFSKIETQELIWPFIDEVILDKKKQIREVIIYGIRIQSSCC